MMKLTKIDLETITTRGTSLKLTIDDEHMHLTTTLLTTNAQFAGLMAQWFVHLPSDERENIIHMMQELNMHG